MGHRSIYFHWKQKKSLMLKKNQQEKKITTVPSYLPHPAKNTIYSKVFGIFYHHPVIKHIFWVCFLFYQLPIAHPLAIFLRKFSKVATNKNSVKNSKNKSKKENQKNGKN